MIQIISTIVLSVTLAVSAACGEHGTAALPQDAGKKEAQDGKKMDKPASKPTADAAVTAIDTFIAEQKVDKTKTTWKTSLKAPPVQKFDAAKKYFWNLKTNKGSIKVQLMQDVAPMHVTSTIYLTKLGFYDGIAFHRVIPGFMAQGGDPLGNGTGGPGYKYAGEFSPKARHTKGGILSMANAGPGTDGSQFFLTFVETAYLNDKHTVFGEVTDGMDTVKALEKCGTRGGATTEPLKIETATITVE